MSFGQNKKIIDRELTRFSGKAVNQNNKAKIDKSLKVIQLITKISVDQIFDSIL